jgi:hypothetical protein
VDNGKYNAFTLPYGYKTNTLWCEVQVVKSSEINEDMPIEEQKATLKILDYRAILDTGASNSVITEKVVRDLNLEVTGWAPVMTANGKTQATLHTVDIWLPNGIGFHNLQVSKGDLGGNPDVLVGMDIIGFGDFSISNYCPVKSKTVSKIEKHGTLNTKRSVKCLKKNI